VTSSRQLPTSNQSFIRKSLAILHLEQASQ
jgi:hypothetical protein